MGHLITRTVQSEHTNISNYVSDLLKKEQLDDNKKHDIKWSAASLYGGTYFSHDADLHSRSVRILVN